MVIILQGSMCRTWVSLTPMNLFANVTSPHITPHRTHTPTHNTHLTPTHHTHPHSSTSSSQVSSHQLIIEKTKLTRKIREYNRKTTPVHHIHLRSSVSTRPHHTHYLTHHTHTPHPPQKLSEYMHVHHYSHTHTWLL